MRTARVTFGGWRSFGWRWKGIVHGEQLGNSDELKAFGEKSIDGFWHGINSGFVDIMAEDNRTGDGRF